MSERVPIPSEAAACNWANGGGAYPSVDPGAAKRAIGWQPKDVPVPGPGEIIPASGHNFLWRLIMEMVSWLRDFAPREWDDLHEGIAAAKERDLLRVMPPIAYSYRGSQVFEISGTATGNTNVLQPCTDGEQIYYLGGTAQAYIVAASPANGAEIWEDNDLTVGLSALCSDGAYLYVQTVDNGNVGLYRMLRFDGSQDDSTSGAPTYYSCDRLVANGAYAVGIAPFGGPGRLVIYSGIQGTIVEDGSYDTVSAGLKAVAIDSDQCYVGGARNTDDIWCLALSSTTTAIWTTTLPTVAAPTVEGIAADGDRVYVSTDRQALTAGGHANLHCLDRITGAVLWSADIQTAFAGPLDLEGITVDDRYVYVVDNANDLWVVTKDGPAAQVCVLGSFGDPCCDGVSVIGNGNAPNRLKRLWIANGPRIFQRVAGSSVHRYPFYNLAIPAE